MKLQYSLLVLALALAYGIITQLFPDFPISQEVLLAFVVYVLLKLGVEVVDAPIRGYLQERGLMAGTGTTTKKSNRRGK